jgi:hypothetical protein
MTADELLSLDRDFGTVEDAERLLKWKVPTWATSISSHKLDCYCFCELRFGELSIQEFRELDNMHNKLRAYFKKIEKETEIRKAALKYDC